MRLLFDIETDNLLDKMTKIHCIVIRELLEPDAVEACGGNFATVPRLYHNGSGIYPRAGNLLEAIRWLEEADLLLGHNIMSFDIPAIQKLYDFTPKAKLHDTLISSRLIWPREVLRGRDFQLIKKGWDFPAKLAGNHGLEAWGRRTGHYKGDFHGPWDTFTQEMLDYCVQDTKVNLELYNRILARKYSQAAIDVEHDVAHIVRRQEAWGVGFDCDAAAKLYAKLSAKREELRVKLLNLFDPWFTPGQEMTPKRPNKTHGYAKGATFTKLVLTEFNPGSRDHVASRLIKLYGWKPNEFTNEGKPKVDETILTGLKLPDAPLDVLIESFTLDKRIGQLAEGKQAWMKVEKDGRIYGSVNTQGAVTGRMTHSKPNMAQVPRTASPYGGECRALFTATARPGWVLVGIDASGLELRALSHYLSRWDGGEYGKAVVEGKQSEGTDVHTRNQRAIEIETRDDAKTFFYALVYGAGDGKLGSISKKGPKHGKQSRNKFLDGIVGFRQLVEGVQEKAVKDKWLRGLDGRYVYIRGKHVALNTLLQGAGAIVMKVALVIFDGALQEAGFIPGVDYEFCLNVHDEWQVECRKEIADKVGKLGVTAIEEAGRVLKMRVPLTGEYSVGVNWEETH